MNFESSRLRTFQNWPASAPVDSQRIARAGFYYMGQNLEVQCFSCGGRISEWQYGDKVMTKHRLLDPRCPFVLNPVDSGNVPINETGNRNFNGESSNVDKRPIESELHDKSTKYRTEAARLETFVTWPIPSKVDGYRLAKAGFYYLQELDKVRCAFCGIDAYNWEAGDDPIVEHRRHSPMCPFLSNLSVGSSSQNSNDVLVLRDNYFNFEPEYGLDANRMKDFGILNHRIPKHPKFMTEESRTASYEKWPKKSIKDPLELAKAGFYYTGVEDKVRCYHCGGGLQKWKANDDPWVEHTKWFSNCDFIFLVKGEDFITEIKKSFLKKESGSEDTVHASDGSMSAQYIDDNILQVLMTSAPVLNALDLGLDVSRIKQVLRDQLMRHQKGFGSEDELIAAVLDAQFNEPVADLTEESWIGESLSNSCITRQLPALECLSEASSSNQDQNTNNVDDYMLNPILIPELNERTLEPPDEYNIESENLSEVENETVAIGTSSEKKSFTELAPPNRNNSVDESKSTHLLEEENRKLKEAKLCKICMDQDINIVFLPCGHLVTCSSCAANIPDCPVCRQMIKGTVRTFLA